ncbi:hypothetical protein ACL02S_23125 [Nocardia sp. 004]|uniref:hypothetical protein n=1 Tax=Nocardia sp. 004 TaxID=3385978 RepID=UPI0039A0F7BE
MMLVRFTSAFAAAATLTGIAFASAQPLDSSQSKKHCVGSSGSRVCLQVWPEFGVLKAQPSGDYSAYTLEAIDTTGQYGNTISYRDALTGKNRAVDLGPVMSMTIRTQGIARIGQPRPDELSAWVTVSWSKPE